MLLWIRNGRDIPDPKKPGQYIKRRYDVIQADKSGTRSYGRKSGPHGKDFLNNGMGNFIHLRVHVPGLPEMLKGEFERPTEIFNNELAGKHIGEEYLDHPPQPDTRYPRSYYLDWDALPGWAQLSLNCEGECTLPMHIAVEVIKRRDTGLPDPEMFRRLHG